MWKPFPYRKIVQKPVYISAQLGFKETTQKLGQKRIRKQSLTFLLKQGIDSFELNYCFAQVKFLGIRIFNASSNSSYPTFKNKQVHSNQDV